MAGLTARQEKFVEHYALCGNAAEAARLAGYSAKTSRQIGSRMLSNVDIKAALQARQQVFRDELGVTKQDVVSGILSAIQMGREQQNPAVMIAGLAQIAKLCGFYDPEKIDLSAEGERLISQFSLMTDAQLVAVIAGSGQAIAGSDSE